MALINQPAVIQRVMDWSLTLFVLGGVGFLAATFIPQMLQRQDRNAAASEKVAEKIGELSIATREVLSRDDDVRMAVRTLSGQVDTLIGELKCRSCMLVKGASAGVSQ